MRPQSQCQTLRKRLRSTNGDYEAASINLSQEDAYKILELSPGASFDEIVAAKNKLLASSGSNQNRVLEVEAAYDVLFMLSMKQRLSGQVASSVRYADVPAKRRASTQKLPSFKAPTVQYAKGPVLATQGAVFGALAAWALVQALTESPEAQLGDVAGLQLTAALAYAGYSFKENKRLSLGRSVALTVGTFFAGAILGGLIQNWLRVDIVPLGSFGSPGVFVTEVAIITLWAACALLA